MWKHARQAGFTLVEVSVAGLLLTTLVAGLFAAFIAANRWIKPQDNSAHNLAREKIDRLYEAVRQDWWNASGWPLSVGGPYAEAAISLDGVSYTRTYTITSVDRDGDMVEDYRKADVVVSWPSS